MSDEATPAKVRLTDGLGPLVEKLRERRQAVAWSRGQDADYPTKWEPDALCQQAAEAIRCSQEELTLLRGERKVFIGLLVECDKVLSTLEGESDEEAGLLAGLRYAILGATMPHRRDEAELLAVRASLEG